MAPTDDDASTASISPDGQGGHIPDITDIAKLFSDTAADVDADRRIPFGHFDALASKGLYGVFAPRRVGGLGLDLDAMCSIIEELASACLATTFVWIQHFRLLDAVLDPATPEGLRDLLTRVVSGDLKGGVALGGLLPGPARLRAEPTDDGWRLEGEAPWVSGWGMIDRIFVTARTSTDQVVSLVMDATEQPGLEVRPVRLAALNASSTVHLDFRGLTIDESHRVGRQPYEPRLEAPEGLRANGSLALGVARRCCELMGPSVLDAQLVRARDELSYATSDTIAPARARAALLAARAARRLTVLRGSRAAVSGDVAERSQREATFLLVFGSRPSIKAALLDSLVADGP